MKIEITIERLRRGRWTQHAKGRFEGTDMQTLGPQMDEWTRQKGIPSNPEPGWAIRIAVT